jgi:DNA repair photolyase
VGNNLYEDMHMLREMTCETTIDYEYPPDGGKVPILDPYDGCSLRCPYCFQWGDATWNQEILVKTNFPEMLTRELKGWDATQALYIGSRCDPYMPIEERYQLTRKTIQVLQAHDIPCYICTKSDSEAFLRDLDLFIEYGEKLTICLGLTNLHQLQKPREAHELPNIKTANILVQSGINTMVFITPTLPGITDIDGMIAALPDSVKILLDALRLGPENASTPRFFEFVKTFYPKLEPMYRQLVSEGTLPYYEELKQKYKSHPRISFVFGEN